MKNKPKQRKLLGLCHMGITHDTCLGVNAHQKNGRQLYKPNHTREAPKASGKTLV